MAVDLREFQVLVGPNGSGKSTLLDALKFVGDFVSNGLEAAFKERTNNPETLFFGKKLGRMMIVIDFSFPDFYYLDQTQLNEHKTGRYTLELTLSSPYSATLAKEMLVIANEPFALENDTHHYLLDWLNMAEEIQPSSRLIVFDYESTLIKWGETYSNYQVQSDKSALGYANNREILRLLEFVLSKFTKGIEFYHLSSEHLMNPSPPGAGTLSRSNGSSLPWQAQHIKTFFPSDFKSWMKQVRTAIPDIEDIRVVVREEDRHAYLVVRWENGLELPSWSISEGTLRLLALTLLGFQLFLGDMILVEEPENGIHPQAVESVVQALKYSIGRQFMITSHSPTVINTVVPADLLCFVREKDGGVSVMAGDQHPRLLNWKKSVSLGTIFASGVLDIQS